MAQAPKALGGGKYGDLSKRLFFLLGALVVYRIGAHIPVPGINPDQLQKLFQNNSGGILGLFNMFSGGALSRFFVWLTFAVMALSAAALLYTLVAPG